MLRIELYSILNIKQRTILNLQILNWHYLVSHTLNLAFLLCGLNLGVSKLAFNLFTNGKNSKFLGKIFYNYVTIL